MLSAYSSIKLGKSSEPRHDSEVAASFLFASVVRQLEVHLFKVARARVTLARMSLAFAVQINGFGLRYAQRYIR